MSYYTTEWFIKHHYPWLLKTYHVVFVLICKYQFMLCKYVG
uniref:Uncharacterized protein n=1 Tax=Rhizophora mucronata TaxID=61149 RepID=A0A2P2Q7U7_RHIMU